MPVPESRETLELQQRQLLSGNRRVMMFPKGHRELRVPRGMDRVRAPNGDTFHFNPKLIKSREIINASKAGRENDLLDLGPISKNDASHRVANGEQGLAVVERDRHGTEARAAAGTNRTAPAQVEAMERTKSPGHRISIEHPAETIARRGYAEGGAIPPLPPGFTLDDPSSGNVPPLPEGFTLDQPNGVDVLKNSFASGEKPDLDAVRAAGGLRQQQETGGDDELSAEFLRGIPVLGAYTDQAGAAVSAAANPVTGVGASGDSFSDRYAENLANERADRLAYEKQHPNLSSAAQIAGGIASMLPLGATGIGARALGIEGGNLATRIGASAASNAAIGAADAAARGEDVTTGTGAGLVGGFSGPLASGAFERLIRPVMQSPARNAMVNILRREGVIPTAGQASGSKPLRYAESALGDAPLAGGRAADLMEQQGEAFTRAALRRAGTDAPRATPDVMQATSDRIGNEFQRLSANNTMRLDHQFGNDIGRVLSEYDRVLPSQQREVVANVVDDVLGYGQRMPGDVYQETRSRLSRQSHAIRQNDPAFSQALAGIRDALDNAMGRSIQPADRGAWNTARRQWGAYRTIEKAASAAGENASMGIISPAQLRNAVAVRNRSAYVRGHGDLSDLARAGTAILNPLPNSGTAQRNLINHAMASIAGGAIGGGAGEINGAGFWPGAVAGALAPGVAGRALLSRPVQGYLNNALARPQVAAALRGLGAVGAPALSRQQASGLGRLLYQSDGQ